MIVPLLLSALSSAVDWLNRANLPFLRTRTKKSSTGQTLNPSELTEFWTQEPEFWDAIEAATPYDLDEEVEIDYIVLRAEGKTPEQAYSMALLNWDLK